MAYRHKESNFLNALNENSGYALSALNHNQAMHWHQATGALMVIETERTRENQMNRLMSGQ